MQNKGLHRDYDLLNQPKNTSPYIRNANLTEEYGSVSNERSAEPITNIPSGYRIIGTIVLDDNQKVLFLVNDSSGLSYIVLQKQNNTIVNITNPSSLLGLRLTNQIEGVYKRNLKGDYIIYWVDDYNVPRWLNITNPDVDINLLTQDEIDKLNIFYNFKNSRLKPSDPVSVPGGDLKTGVYYLCYCYVDKYGNKTNYSGFQNPVPIVAATNLTNYTQYDGNVAGTSTSKAISMYIDSSDLDSKYNYINIGVISKINGVLKAYDFATYYYDTSLTSLTVIVDSLSNAEEVAIDDLIVNKASYTKAKTIKSLDNELFMGNLESIKDINLQPYFNRTIVQPFYEEIVDLNTVYKNEFNATINKSFCYDEVYALYGSVVWKDGTETKAFHIPGRPLKLADPGYGVGLKENSLLTGITNPLYSIATVGTEANEIYNIDPTAKIFNAIQTSDSAQPYDNASWAVSTDMGYYENQNEFYPDHEQWDIKNTSNTVVGTLRNQKVRHHKMPSAKNHLHRTTYDEVNLLSLVIKNLDFPTSIKNNIFKVNFYYAKRTANNRLILGQSLLIEGAAFHKPTTDDSLKKSFLNGWGNILCHDVEEIDSVYEAGIALNSMFNDPTYSFGINLHKANAAGTQDYDFNNKGYFRFHAFDLLSNNIDISGASYLQIVKAYTSQYKLFSASPDPAWVQNNLQSYAGATLDFNNGSFNNFASLTTNSTIRRITNKNYIPYDYNGTGTLDPLVFTNPFSMYMTPNNIGGETAIIIETQNRLFNYNFQDCDFTNNASINSSFNDVANTGINNLVNLCQYKNNLYNEFDNQELCYFGTYTVPNLTSSVDIPLLGGDVFINWYAFKTTSQLGKLRSGGTQKELTLIAMHNFICQTNSNVGYRHQGISDTEIYYPKTPLSAPNSILNQPTNISNWFGYNSDYSSLNDIKQPIINDKIPNEEPFDYKTRVIKSNKDSYETLKDSFREFLANNKVDLDTNRGEIEKLARSSDLLIIHLTKALTRTMSRQTLQVDDTTAYLGSSDIFSIPTKEIIYTDIGYGGTTSQWANVVTPFGYIFPDTENRKIFSLGDNIKEISSNGMINFFNDNCKLLLYEQLKGHNNFIFPLSDNPANDQGTGFIATWDTKYRRYILTKRDYIISPNFLSRFKGEYNPLGIYNSGDVVWNSTISKWQVYSGGVFVTISRVDPVWTSFFLDRSWTISYYPEFECWGSFYDYIPYGYTEDSTNFYGFSDTKIYRHNSDNSFGVFYNNIKYPFIVDIVYNDNPNYSKIWNSFSYMSKFTNLNQNIDYLKTFDKFTTYNSYQLSKTTDLINLQNCRYVKGIWNVSQFRNLRDDYNIPVYDKDYNLYSNVDLTKPFNFRDGMNDKFMVSRLQFDNDNVGVLSLQYSDSFNQPEIR